jgi:dTDP-glucose pyrophosphorylase
MRAPASAALDPRQAAAADAGMKAMMPFGRPFLDFVLHALADAGVTDAGLVLGPEHESVRAYYRGLATTRIGITFVEQPEPLGTANAVTSARAWAGTGSFLVLNADNLYPEDVLTRLVRGREPALPGFERDSLGIPIERIGAFALLEVNDEGLLRRIVEKPGVEVMGAAGSGALVSMNLWRFDDRIFEACEAVPLSERGERELPQAVALAVQRGTQFDVFRAQGPVLDLSSRADVANVARALAGCEVVL